jgi:hypothetical protein
MVAYTCGIKLGIEFLIYDFSNRLLLPQHGASSGCGWRRRPSDVEVAANILNKQSITADKG